MAEAALSVHSTDPALLTAVGHLLSASSLKVTASHLQEVKATSVTAEVTRERTKAADIESAIRKKKLQDALKTKQELEEKLSHIKNSINTFDAIKPVQEESPQKKKLFDKQARAEYYKELELKQKESQRLARKFLEEQQERRARHEEHHRKQMELLLTEDAELSKLKETRQTEIEEIKQNKIKAIKDRLAQRREERNKLMQIGQEELVKVKANKPLHVQIKERYHQEVMMPELEKHKTELAKKRIHFTSVNRQDLQEHAKRYEEMKRDLFERRSQQATQVALDHLANLASSKHASKFTYAIIEEERRKKQQLLNPIEEKRKMIEKQRQYASLIKEIYVPVVDLTKRAEVDGRKGKYSSSVSAKEERTDLESKAASVSESVPNAWRPHKFKQNPLITPPQPKKEPIKVDYLGDRRRERETSDVHDESKQIDLHSELQGDLTEKGAAARLIQKAQRVELAARRKELSLSTGVTSDAHVEAMGSINDALLSSVKAKLALLDSVTRQ
jgi:hypothetical protein